MGGKWRKAKVSLGLNLCVVGPRTLEDSPPSLEAPERLSDAALLSPDKWSTVSSQPSTPTPSSHGLRLPKSGSKSSKVSSCLITIVAAWCSVLCVGVFFPYRVLLVFVYNL